MENKLNIVVSNRTRSEAFRPPTHERWACISIFTPGDSPAEIIGFEKVIHLCFDDVCGHFEWHKEDGSIPTMTRFTPEMAKETWGFIDEIIQSEIPNLLVHCDAGISRSPGMAIAIDEIVNGSHERAAKHPYYNSHVYKTMINEDQIRKDGGFTFVKDIYDYEKRKTG
jgi:predicted protein tyrosine phosphatase